MIIFYDIFKETNNKINNVCFEIYLTVFCNLNTSVRDARKIVYIIIVC